MSRPGAALRPPFVLIVLMLLLGFPIAGCTTSSGGAAGTARGAQARTLPKGASEAEIRHHCTDEARREAEKIPAIQSGQTTYTGSKDHDFEGCLRRHGI